MQRNALYSNGIKERNKNKWRLCLAEPDRDSFLYSVPSNPSIMNNHSSPTGLGGVARRGVVYSTAWVVAIHAAYFACCCYAILSCYYINHRCYGCKRYPELVQHAKCHHHPVYPLTGMHPWVLRTPYSVYATPYSSKSNNYSVSNRWVLKASNSEQAVPPGTVASHPTPAKASPQPRPIQLLHTQHVRST